MTECEKAVRLRLLLPAVVVAASEEDNSHLAKIRAALRRAKAGGYEAPLCSQSLNN